MKLLTKEILSKIPRLYSQEHVKDPVVYVKFFHPLSHWRWYATEYSPKEKLFFGWVAGDFPELGYFSLKELESVRIMGLGIERDMYFTPARLSEVKRRHAQYGAANPRRRLVPGDKVIVSKIIFPAGGAWDIEPTPGTIIGGPYKKEGDYWVRLDKKPKGFGYTDGYVRPSWMKLRPANPLSRADLPLVYATPRNIEKWAQPGLVMYSPGTKEFISPDVTDIAGVPRGSKFLDRTGSPMILALKFPKRSLIALNPQMAANPRPHTEVRTARIPKCDFCPKPAQYDFRTFRGPWAYGCLEHYRMNRAYPELGLGYGQKLIAAGAAK